eukprot:TRINITY_DN75757_c0_g1_i1.p1 TRINITY_DN75757_c0_g1~~TRINITY_DN75757_c0_g1_i1.p1  ORF type:complete len:498 (-),score=70.39 TRINITY_DN75757_c0_g1_i1:53-1486(-)
MTASMMKLPSGRSLFILEKQLCELIMSFPAAVIGGVTWQALVEKYEKRQNMRLDVVSLGFSSALVAASTLLSDVARIVDAEDANNPLLVLEDQATLTPHPGMVGCWPSIYSSLCQIVRDHGEDVTASVGDGSGLVVFEMFMAQVKPSLESHWHPNYDENSFCYLNKRGMIFKFKKTKYLIEAMLCWREQRASLLEGMNDVGESALDEALSAQLELVPTKKRNDLKLRCYSRSGTKDRVSATVRESRFPIDERYAVTPYAKPTQEPREVTAPIQPIEHSDQSSHPSESADVGTDTTVSETVFNIGTLGKPELAPTSLPGSPREESEDLGASIIGCQTSGQPRSPFLEPEVFDDPYEPPPQAKIWIAPSGGFSPAMLLPSGSSLPTTAPVSGSCSPIALLNSASSARNSGDPSNSSGAITPSTQWGVLTPMLWEHACTNVLSWMPVVPSSDVCSIPNGIVEGLCKRLESAPMFRLHGQK